MAHPFNKALAYLNNKKYDKALAIYKKLWAETPYKEIALNMGSCYRGLGDWDNAAKYWLEAVDPNLPFTDNSFTKEYPQALNNLGLLAYTFEQDEVAAEFYARALAVDPEYHEARWNYSQAIGRMYCSNKYDKPANVWHCMDSRFYRANGVRIKSKKKDLIAWNYTDKVESLVVLVEQGFGDHLQFGRYLSLLENFADKIWVQCHPRAAIFYDKYLTCSDPSETDATHGVAICNLAKISDTIPSGDWLKDKYVKKSPNEILDIGITWSGNAAHGNDHYRSSKPGYFRQLSRYGNLYSLNPTEAGTRGFTDLKSGSWSETITELSKLDLVICVDTSIAHLCGSLGMECWCIMPLHDSDYRWGDTSMGYDNIWYKSVKVIRNNGSWEDAIDHVSKLLELRIENNNNTIRSL